MESLALISRGVILLLAGTSKTYAAHDECESVALTLADLSVYGPLINPAESDICCVCERRFE